MPHAAAQCLTLPHNASRCRTMLHAAAQCLTLPHNASRCRTMPHAAAQCFTLPQNASRCRTMLGGAQLGRQVHEDICVRSSAMATRDITCKGCEFDYWEIIAPAMQALEISLGERVKGYEQNVSCCAVLCCAEVIVVHYKRRPTRGRGIT
ncbi:hypothetical protein E2C01_037085 [Portunus trituberculatus]|uniref:Uncharacterized protein n=1 Tax=Portunus trituberculatus TaxID=210409 RepID=A0A5B7FD11_PORTR|nr:hypothetical protein [Portunus trituberculatus]